MPYIRVGGVTLQLESISEHGSNHFVSYEGVAGWICRKLPGRVSVGTPMGTHLATTENIEFLRKYMPKTAALLQKSVDQDLLDEIASGG